MSFLDKAKKLAEQAAEKAGPLIDKAAPHAQNAADKAGQQIDKRTGGKYHDKLEAVETKVGELADKRMGTGAGADGTRCRGRPVPGPARLAGQPGQTFPAAPADADIPAPPDQTLPRGARQRRHSPPPARTQTFPAQPDPAGQPDDPATRAPGEPEFPGLSEGPSEEDRPDPPGRRPVGPAGRHPDLGRRRHRRCRVARG